MPTPSPLRIRLAPERRGALLVAITQYFANEFDEPLSPFRAEGLLDLLVAKLGPPIYNQGVRDACQQMHTKLADLDGEIYEPES